VCLINSGFNDHIDTTTSLGTAATDSSTSAGFVDNLKVLIDRLRAIFDAMVVATTLPAGSTLTFVVIPSHPMSDTTTTPGTGSYAAREGITQTYRQGVLELAQSRTDVIPVDLFTLLGPNPFSALYNRRLTLSNTGVPASDDVLHLTPAGYRWLGGRIVGALDYAGRRINYVGPTRLFGG
jgi:lysophospholipase L1-like esterase